MAERHKNKEAVSQLVYGLDWTEFHRLAAICDKVTICSSFCSVLAAAASVPAVTW